MLWILEFVKKGGGTSFGNKKQMDAIVDEGAKSS